MNMIHTHGAETAAIGDIHLLTLAWWGDNDDPGYLEAVGIRPIPYQYRAVLLDRRVDDAGRIRTRWALTAECQRDHHPDDMGLPIMERRMADVWSPARGSVLIYGGIFFGVLGYGWRDGLHRYGTDLAGKATIGERVGRYDGSLDDLRALADAHGDTWADV